MLATRSRVVAVAVRATHVQFRSDVDVVQHRSARADDALAFASRDGRVQDVRQHRGERLSATELPRSGRLLPHRLSKASEAACAVLCLRTRGFSVDETPVHVARVSVPEQSWGDREEVVAHLERIRALTDEFERVHRDGAEQREIAERVSRRVAAARATLEPAD